MTRALLFALLALATPLRAEEACPMPDLAPLVAELTGWISSHSDLDTKRLAAVTPEIVFCAPQDHVSYAGGELLVDDGLLAAYDLAARRIYLVAPWDARDPRNVSTLLHELVHAAQFDSHAWDCAQASEWQAYQLQAEWLAEHGSDAGFDWPAIALQSLCPSDVHP
jgi:hypothetical protein